MEKGSTLLKVVSILMIIFGGLGLLLSLLGLLGAGFLAAMPDEIAGVGVGEELAQLAVVSSVIIFIGSAVQLVAGIVGVKNHNKSENAKVCMIIACVVIAVQLLGNIFDISTSGFTGATGLNVVIGLVIPVLYLIGALQLKKLGEQSQYPMQ
ncbi:MAG: hypothetical protein FWC20_00970 [Oscillospiraceae bacterium]|nr:hypothetical protein [Oscillospiraceae bacterium]MCL2277964.1 hypothetical protein [Oscillospiraceae bacterium]